MPLRSLPDRPDLDQLKRQARELQRAHRGGLLSAAARIAGHHPQLRNRGLREVLDGPFTLADSQLVIAREYGFASWAKLKHHAEVARRCASLRPNPKLGDAIAALDAGELDRLRTLLGEDPLLVHARGELDPPYGYFTGATLLHHIAANPYRVPLPTNIVEVARLLLDAGADPNALTLSPGGGNTTMGLIITSAHCSEVGAAAPLMDLLLARGAKLDVRSPEALRDSITNYGFQAAEKMIQLGATMDILAAAALGRLDLVRALFDAEGHLTALPLREGKPLSERDAIGLAFLHAYVGREPEVADFLLERDGNWNMIGVNNGTALHRATSGGDLPMVQRLVQKGADLNDRNNPFCATPISWADHAHQQEVFNWMRTHCPVDLHDAVCFDLPEHLEARLAEDPRALDRPIDQWHVPQSTPLYWAAYLGKTQLARRLLQKGADPNRLAGDGRTALDLAEEKGHTETATLLREHGARRTAEL
jgi:ankyrin repeat protein